MISVLRWTFRALYSQGYESILFKINFSRISTRSCINNCTSNKEWTQTEIGILYSIITTTDNSILKPKRKSKYADAATAKAVFSLLPGRTYNAIRLKLARDRKKVTSEIPPKPGTLQEFYIKSYIKHQDVQKDIAPRIRNYYWTDEENKLLQEGLALFGKDFVYISNHVGTRTANQCRLQYYKYRSDATYQSGLKSYCGIWKRRECLLLLELKAKHGERWDLIAPSFPRRRVALLKQRYLKLDSANPPSVYP